MNIILESTSPKKKDHNNMASFKSNHLINLARDKILIAIPENNASRKLPLIDVQAALKPDFFSENQRYTF